jgi:hypothetical protein
MGFAQGDAAKGPEGFGLQRYPGTPPVRPTERAWSCRWVNAAICAEVHRQPRSACRITSSATCPETKKAAAFQKLTVQT